MGQAYDVGEVIIPNDEIMLYNFTRGKKINIYPYIGSFDIVESIENATYTADFFLTEGTDLIDNFPIVGEEWITITFETPERETKTYEFFVQSVDAQKSDDMSIRNMYKLSCTSKGEIMNTFELYTKRYGYPKQQKYHEVIAEIIKTDWTAGASLIEMEETVGFFDYVCNDVRPLQAIDLVRERAVSASNKSSMFFFFQDYKGYHFVTAEKFSDRPEFGPYVLDTTNRAAPYEKVINFRNIISFAPLNHGDAISKVKSGSIRNIVYEFDIMTGLYCKKYEYNDQWGSYKKFGAAGDFNSGAFKGEMKKVPATVKYVVKDGTRYESKHNENIHWKRPYRERISQYGIWIRVYGDSNITVGDKIRLEMPQVAYADDLPEREYFNETYFCSQLKQTFYKKETGHFEYYMNMDLRKTHLKKDP